ncbi:hypothetical protein [Desulfovibrio sp. DV]|uniref:hypothetical protein n=1 Tax=Desulfovibrio sp. DV TaxID=1844708 RepID=UPI0011153089|nr:hypothetical protein [Desulfovibrio sp. DV]
MKDVIAGRKPVSPLGMLAAINPIVMPEIIPIKINENISTNPLFSLRLESLLGSLKSSKDIVCDIASFERLSISL